MKVLDKLLGVFTVAANVAYVVWLFLMAQGILGGLLVAAEALIVSLSALFVVNHWRQRPQGSPGGKANGSLDVFLTVVDENSIMFEATLNAASSIDYDRKTVYVLDDGGRDEIRALAQKYGAKYLSRPERCDRKAGNLNFGLEHSEGEYVLVLDADQIVDPAIASDLLGYFSDDEKTAIVTTRQRFMAPRKDFNHDNLFYGEMQVGKDSDNAAISCGSGVFYRRSALAEIGGFQTWNIVEDLYTSYILHQRGYKSRYVSKPYTKGTAPRDLEVIYHQRGRWATDTLRLFLHKNPLLAPGLTFPQRLHYFEIGWAYIVAAFALPVLFLLPPLTLITGERIIPDPLMYVLVRAPTIMLVLYFYYRLSGNTFETSQYWASLSPVYLAAFFKALRMRDIRKCTPPKANPKERVLRRRNLKLILPQLAYVGFGIAAIIYRIFLVDHAFTMFVAINMFWVAVMAFWFAPVIYRELLGCHYCSFEDLTAA